MSSQTPTKSSRLTERAREYIGRRVDVSDTPLQKSIWAAIDDVVESGERLKRMLASESVSRETDTGVDSPDHKTHAHAHPADYGIALRRAEGGDFLSDANREKIVSEKGPGIAVLLDTLKDDDEAERELVEREAIVALGEWIKAIREEEGISQETLAERAGTTPAQISILESGAGKRGVGFGLLTRVLFGLGWKLTFSQPE